MELRPAAAADWRAIWEILRPVFRAGDTYAVDPDISEAAARHYWLEQPLETWVAAEGAAVLGTYYMRRNQPGGGGHVCNCGYVTAAAARGRGIARAMCVASQERARAAGFLAMQFNFVVETNAGALHLWREMGFEAVGYLPRAFRHPQAGLVGAHVLMTWLGLAGGSGLRPSVTGAPKTELL